LSPPPPLVFAAGFGFGASLLVVGFGGASLFWSAMVAVVCFYFLI
jgi:hypothetical protein